MKKIAFYLIIFLAISGCGTSSNESEKTPNHIENGLSERSFIDSLAIPDFIIYTVKDSTIFNSNTIDKDGIIVLKYFSPDCSNCQEEAEAYFEKKDSLQNIRTLWISGDWAQLIMIKDFAEKYNLDELNAVAIGKETTNYLVGHFGLTGVPFAAVYKDNQLIRSYKGSLDFDELIEINYGNSIK
jgi:thiol-disulfide isomerase/thioredoxin